MSVTVSSVVFLYSPRALPRPHMAALDPTHLPGHTAEPYDPELEIRHGENGLAVTPGGSRSNLIGTEMDSSPR